MNTTIRGALAGLLLAVGICLMAGSLMAAVPAQHVQHEFTDAARLQAALPAQEGTAQAVGGWYYMDTNPATVCAANYTDGKEEWIKFEEIQEAADKLSLIELTGQIGFGAVLMRWEVLEGTGQWPFSPTLDPQTGQYMGDDVSFIRRSLARGHRWFLHPEVYLPHLKTNDVAAPRLKIRAMDRDIVDMPFADAAD